MKVVGSYDFLRKYLSLLLKETISKFLKNDLILSSCNTWIKVLCNWHPAIGWISPNYSFSPYFTHTQIHRPSFLFKTMFESHFDLTSNFTFSMFFRILIFPAKINLVFPKKSFVISYELAADVNYHQILFPYVVNFD